MSEINIFLPKWQSIISCLVKQSYKSDLFNKHSAAIIHNFKILSHGYNFRLKNSSIHAEIDAFIKFQKKNHVFGLDIIVIRFENNNLKYSRPCNHCIDFLRRKGFRKIYYSNFNGEIISEYIENMEKTHICSSKKRLYN